MEELSNRRFLQEIQADIQLYFWLVAFDNIEHWLKQAETRQKGHSILSVPDSWENSFFVSFQGR
jgi:hypothetical protein